LRFRRPWSGLLVLLACAGSLSHAQPEERAVARFSLADQMVTGAWNEWVVTVRDAPGAEIELRIDVGSALQPVEPWVVRASVPEARGVQSVRIPVAIPSWRALSWKVTFDGRVLGSGSWSARERDDRRLGVILSESPAQWIGALGEDGRWVSVNVDELPTLFAGWDAVSHLVVGSVPVPPRDVMLLTAAVAGVHVQVPQDQGILEALRPMNGDAHLNVGAGTLTWLAGEPESQTYLDQAVERLGSARPQGAWEAEAAGAIASATHAAMPLAGWPHLSRGFVAWGLLGYVLLVTLLLRVPARAGWISAIMVALAAIAVSPLLQPGASEQVSEDRIVLAASGLGSQTNLKHLVSHAGGDVTLDGFYRLHPRGDHRDLPIVWSEGATQFTLPPGGRVQLEAAPLLTEVPESVLQAVGQPGVPLSAARAEGLLSLRDTLAASFVRQEDTWWWMRDVGSEGWQP